MERNPYFWEVDSKGQRLPYVDAVVYAIVPDMNAMSLRFLKGEADLQEVVRPEEYEHFKEEAAKRKFRLLDTGIVVGAGHAHLSPKNPEKNPKDRRTARGPGEVEMVSQHEVSPGDFVRD